MKVEVTRLRLRYSSETEIFKFTPLKATHFNVWTYILPGTATETDP